MNEGRKIKDDSMHEWGWMNEKIMWIKGYMRIYEAE